MDWWYLQPDHQHSFRFLVGSAAGRTDETFLFSSHHCLVYCSQPFQHWLIAAELYILLLACTICIYHYMFDGKSHACSSATKMQLWERAA